MEHHKGRLNMRLIIAVLGLAASTTAFGQSLGEVARKEKERREKQPSGAAAKQYSDKDLKELPPAAASEIVVSATPSPSAPPGDRSWQSPDSASNQRRDEEARWRQRMATARARVGAARKRYDYLKDLNLVPGESYVDNNNQPVFSNPRQIRAAVAAAKAELDAAEAAVAGLEEEARRAGVPPGWLR